MTNELVVMLNGAEHGCVLHKNKKKSNWHKADLTKAVKNGCITGYDSTSDGNAYFVIPMSAITSLTLIEGDISHHPPCGMMDADPDCQPYKPTEQDADDPNYG